MAWSGIRGQDLAVQMLQTHIALQRVSPAYLLAGPSGVGKKPIAREYAKALNCQSDTNRPCDACPPCTHIQRGTHPDVHWLLPEGASKQLKIEQIRHVIGRLSLRPFSARFQVAVIDGADRMTHEAANSLLKILEEPPTHTRFMLLTSQVSDCLPTIVSRCQLVRCRPLSHTLLQDLLVEQGAGDARVAAAVAPLSAGSVTNALTLVERWDKRQAIMNQLASDLPVAWYAGRPLETREEATELLDEMVAWLRDLALMRVGSTLPLVHAAHQDALAKQAQRVDPEQCLEALEKVLALRDSIEEQFLSPRLVGMVAREQWLNLVSPHG